MPNNQQTEDDLARYIDQALDTAEAEGRTIDRVLARQIAAATHQGLGSELERFAGTGRIRHHHAARLELHYLTADDPQMRRWREALLAFITDDQRRQQKAKTSTRSEAKTGHPQPLCHTEKGDSHEL